MSSVSKSNNKRINPGSHPDNIDAEEAKANLAISDLISNITILTARKDPLIRSIKSPALLIRGLKELQGMIEMVDIKRSIVSQIKFLITNQARKGSLPNANKVNFEGHMLHSVISGNPGTGKTTVGMILSKIWMALGFVNKKEAPSSGSATSGGPASTAAGAPVVLVNAMVNTVNDSYRRRIADLEEAQRNDHRKLDRLKELLSKHHTTTGEVRRRVIKLKPSSVATRPSHIVDIDKEWDILLCHSRDLKFGFDEILREVNTKDAIAIGPLGATGGTTGPKAPTTGTTGAKAAPTSTDGDPYENADPKFVVAAREDLIAEYLGQTAIKTKKVLESARGGVLFIDEAYSICNMDGGSKDKYGEECLTTINEFMSLHPDEIIIIFAGYKDKLMQSIFKAQPGLYRRCAYFFEIKDYTHRGLARIFSRQLTKNSWAMAPDIDMEKVIHDNKDVIQDGGGGTEKLSFFVKMEYGNSKFLETIQASTDKPVVHNGVITSEMIAAALVEMRRQVDAKMDDAPPEHMYI